MSDIFTKTSKELSDKHIAFLQNEFDVTKEDILSWDEEKWCEIYDALCDIEVDELCSIESDEEESERCLLASNIVTILGNAYAEEAGLIDE